MRSLLLVLFSIWLATGASGDQLFQYGIESHPKSDAGCARTAQDLGERFTVATGKKIFRASCDKETSDGYQISLTYPSSEEVASMSTDKEYGGLGYRGIYVSREECEKNLRQEIEWFEKGTGLITFVAYCYRDSITFSKTPFAAYVDGFGVAKLRPYRFETLLLGDIFAPASDVTKRITELAKGAGIRVKMVAIADDGSPKLVIRYDDDPDTLIFHSGYFEVLETAKFRSGQSKETQQECRLSRDEAVQAFAPEYNERATWFCTWDRQLFEARLYLARVKPKALARIEIPPLRYESFQKCEAERKEIEAYYKTELKRDVFGSLCGWESGFGTGLSDHYRVRLFIRSPNGIRGGDVHG